MTNKKDKLSQILYDIHNYNCNPTTKEIFLHGHYGSGDEEEVGIDFRVSTTFEKNIKLLETDNSHILIHLHSIGGGWNEGMSIYDNIISCNCPITIVGYSAVCSMSSIVLQAGDLRVLMPNTEFMIHFGNVASENSSIGFSSEGDHEKKCRDKMLNIYAQRCLSGKYFANKKSMNTEKCIKFIDSKIKEKSDWWMSSDEALYYGFCDQIFTKGCDLRKCLKK
jgi:ATP-dependent protease ClpP protease subunit